MKNQVWKKWMAGLLTAGLLAAQPIAVIADDADVQATSETGDSAENPDEEEPAPEDPVPTEEPEQDPAEDPTDPSDPSVPAGEAADDPAEEPAEDNTSAAEPSEAPAPEQDQEDASEDEEEDDESEFDEVEELEDETEKKSDDKKDKDKKDDKDKEEETPAPHQATNEELIAQQEIVHAPVILSDFRFWTVTRKYAFAKDDGADILEEMKEDAEVVGKIPAAGLCYVLDKIEKEGETTWLYVESGEARGFVKDEDLYTGRRAQEALEKYRTVEKDEETGELVVSLSDDVPVASVEEEPFKNNAYTYLRATVNPTVIQKDYAIANLKVNIREKADKEARPVGVMDKGDLCYIVADRDAEWVFVESGSVRGFVMAEDLSMDEEPYETIDEESRQIETAFEDENESQSEEQAEDSEEEKAASDEDLEEPEEETEEEKLAKIDQEKYPVYYEVAEKGEGSFDTAEQKVKPEENEACYYTLTSPKPGKPGGRIRESLLDFASQFIGNPYVWGGTSLTGGADCSGFVQSVYAQYGYTLPRTSSEQSQYGTKIPVEEAEPGDLIFYAEGGSVYHVVIYAGDGQTIEAMNESRGITTGHVYGDAVWATRVLEDEYEEVFDFSGDIGEQNAAQEMYGEDLGEFTITYYCPCEECNGAYAGATATGAPMIQGRTIAVDPSVIPYGTKVIIGGHVFTAEDCGGAIKGNRIDIFVNEHEVCNQLGVRGAHVYLVK